MGEKMKDPSPDTWGICKRCIYCHIVRMEVRKPFGRWGWMEIGDCKHPTEHMHMGKAECNGFQCRG